MIASADSMTSHTRLASKFLSINQHNWCRDTLANTMPGWLRDPADGGKTGGRPRIERNWRGMDDKELDGVDLIRISRC